MASGKPNYHPDLEVSRALEEAAVSEEESVFQYAAPNGSPNLLTALGRLYNGIFRRRLSQMNFQVTVGASQALFNVAQAFIDPGDEVIILEPFFPLFARIFEYSGAVIVGVPLTPGEKGTSAANWRIDEAAIRRAFTCRTKIMIVNNPHNPTGKMFTRDELQLIADLCIDRNVLCLVDEVYSFHVLDDDAKHVSMQTMPGMWDRTLTVGSAGKYFCATGLKTGWVVGDEMLVSAVQKVNLCSSQCAPHPIQVALARLFDKDVARAGTEDMLPVKDAAYLKRKMIWLKNILSLIGITSFTPQAGYFLIADVRDVWKEEDGDILNWLIDRTGMAGVPCSSFYTNEHRHLGVSEIRFCFVRNELNFEEAETFCKRKSQSRS